MHQTFYVDNEEEISSIVDKLRKSVSNENYFVAPPRALVFQSVVNLKLLAKESEKLKKRVILVTQDKIGISMAERAGLKTVASTEALNNNLKTNKFFTEDNVFSKIPESDDGKTLMNENSPNNILHKKQRLSRVGSLDFCGEKSLSSCNVANERDVNRDYFEDKNRRVYADKRESFARKNDINKNVYSNPVTASNDRQQIANEKIKGVYNNMENRIEKIFLNNGQTKKEKTNTDYRSNVAVGKRMKIFIGSFFLLGMLVFGIVVMVVVLPGAEINVVVIDEKQKADVAISGSELITPASGPKNVIPVKFIEKEENLTFSYDSSGVSSGSGSKAEGKVIIYNNYSKQPQVLVATTRLKNKDGKIYRIIKDVTVPGMSSDDESGSVEVEVVADGFGEEFNMDEGVFTIPGFEGSPKHEKFSAEIKEKISGGLMSDNPIRAVSEQDIINAKKETENAVRDKIKKNINSDLEEGYVIMDETMEMNIVQSISLAKVGAEREKFDYTVKAQIKALAFSSDEVKKILIASLEKKIVENVDVSQMKIEYTGILPDFKNKTLNLRAYSEIVKISNFDREAFKREILGKNEQEITDVMGKFENIDNVEIKFNSRFVSRVPKYPQRVKIEVVHQEKNLF